MAKKRSRAGRVCKKKGAKQAGKSPKKKRYPSLRGLKTRDAAWVVSNCLTKAGHDPILVGQACARIYGANQVKKGLLEFAIKKYDPGVVASLIGRLGFASSGENTFTRENCHYDIILSAQPIAVGDYMIDDFNVIKTAKGRIKILTPTDCVRQRLSSFYRFSDQEALTEAVRVARRQHIDMETVKRWSEWEWAGDKFREFVLAVS